MRFVDKFVCVLSFDLRCYLTSENAVTPDNWRDFSDRNMADAQREISLSVALRERIDQLHKANAAAEAAAANAVEGASNTRISQYTEARAAALTHLKKVWGVLLWSVGPHGLSFLACSCSWSSRRRPRPSHRLSRPSLSRRPRSWSVF